MPFAMYGNTHSVVLKGKVYMGGGCASDKLQTCTVVVYNTHSGEWSTLPKCWPWVSSFSLAVVNNQLTMVGGLDLSTHKVTSKLAAWESDSRKWTSPILQCTQLVAILQQPPTMNGWWWQVGVMMIVAASTQLKF